MAPTSLLGSNTIIFFWFSSTRTTFHTHTHTQTCQQSTSRRFHKIPQTLFLGSWVCFNQSNLASWKETKWMRKNGIHIGSFGCNKLRRWELPSSSGIWRAKGRPSMISNRGNAKVWDCNFVQCADDEPVIYILRACKAAFKLTKIACPTTLHYD